MLGKGVGASLYLLLCAVVQTTSTCALLHVAHVHSCQLCTCQQEAHEFLEAAILSSSAPDEAFQRFDVLAARHADALRQLTKKVQDARLARDTEALKHAVIAYEEALEAYIPGKRPSGTLNC